MLLIVCTSILHKQKGISYKILATKLAKETWVWSSSSLQFPDKGRQWNIWLQTVRLLEQSKWHSSLYFILTIFWQIDLAFPCYLHQDSFSRQTKSNKWPSQFNHVHGYTETWILLFISLTKFLWTYKLLRWDRDLDSLIYELNESFIIQLSCRKMRTSYRGWNVHKLCQLIKSIVNIQLHERSMEINTRYMGHVRS